MNSTLQKHIGSKAPGVFCSRCTLLLAFAIFGLNPLRGMEVLPGTERLQTSGDLAAKMVAGIDHFLTEQIEQSVQEREKLWQRNFSSPRAYAQSVQTNRAHLRKCIGVVDERLTVESLELVGDLLNPAMSAETEFYSIYSVRWPVLPGVFGEGLLLQPKTNPRANIVALPDADQTPEMLAGLAAGIADECQFARRLAESGCQVVVPLLIDRNHTWSGSPLLGRHTKIPHREWIYRQAFPVGRHIIGYEVQKVLAAVDWFEREAQRAQPGGQRPRIGVAGYGEGGLIAFYAAAADTRIDAALVSGYFDSRQRIWDEPYYRNVFGLLHEFGDGEIASLIGPRSLIIEYSHVPDVPEAITPGKIRTPSYETVNAEFERALKLIRKNPQVSGAFELIVGDGGHPAVPGSPRALAAFLKQLGAPTDRLGASSGRPKDTRQHFSASDRQQRQVKQLEELSQKLIERSERERKNFWDKAKPDSTNDWVAACKWYREFYWSEILGRFPPPNVPAQPRTRLLYDEAKWSGYEVVLDVWPGVFAYGILLVPKDIQPGEKRPVVVCQHGVEGRAQDAVNPKVETAYYRSFGAKLADRGFVVYAPQNPYLGGVRFRMLNRKANPLKKTFLGIIVGQHQRTVEWLSGLQFVDPDRLAFYGLSYGGYSAMRLPALVEGYCLSICSGNFNDWIRVITSTTAEESYVFSEDQFEMFGEFNAANTFNYAELAWLIAPRPFMVERGHRDSVARDEWVAYEYAKVRRLYASLGIPERTEIEFFMGAHDIHGKASFDFLHKHLRWPAP